MASKSTDKPTPVFDTYRCVVCGHTEELHTPSEAGFAGFFHCGSRMAKEEPPPRPGGGGRKGE